MRIKFFDNKILIYKPRGLTPKDIIDYLKSNFKFLKKSKLSYAGRLDPMAHGLTLILKDKECYKQHMYHNMDKIYTFKLLLGVTTDTYDVLGLIEDKSIQNIKIDINIFNKIIENLKCTMIQKYPPYSSIRINGKPLWYYSKNNLLNTIKVPSKEIEIKEIEYSNIKVINKKKLLRKIREKILRIDKDKNFRQIEILKKWQEINEINYLIIDMKAYVSCGTYIRSICKLIGEKMKYPSLAFDIKRDKIGKYYL